MLKSTRSAISSVQFEARNTVSTPPERFKPGDYVTLITSTFQAGVGMNEQKTNNWVIESIQPHQDKRDSFGRVVQQVAGTDSNVDRFELHSLATRKRYKKTANKPPQPLQRLSILLGKYKPNVSLSDYIDLSFVNPETNQPIPATDKNARTWKVIRLAKSGLC